MRPFIIKNLGRWTVCTESRDSMGFFTEVVATFKSRREAIAYIAEMHQVNSSCRGGDCDNNSVAFNAAKPGI